MNRSPRVQHLDDVDAPRESSRSHPGRSTRRWTVLGRAIDAPWVEAGPERAAPRAEMRPVVPLPVPAGQASPRVSAKAELRIKRFGAGGVDDDRYVVPLHANADPASLLAALAGAASEIEELSGEWPLDDRLILTVSLRR